MYSNNPLVSLIIPCHNQGEFLNDALASVHHQIYGNFECLLINDGSTDNSKEIGLKWQNKDLRFKYFEQENLGVSAARNLGLSEAKGDFIQFLDADDIISKHKLSASLKCFESDKALDIVISNFSMFTREIMNRTDPYCDLSSINFSLDSFLFQWQISFSLPIHCSLLRANAINSSRFDEELSAQEDWLFWLSIYRTNPKTIFLNKNMAYYRYNPNGRTQRDYYKDQVLFIDKLKSYLDQDIYQDFLKHRMFKYYEDVQSFKIRNRNIEKSWPFRFFRLQQRIIKKFRVVFNINSRKTKTI
jgi:glycosyltransferase involved in cell wall biosynthesis